MSRDGDDGGLVTGGLEPMLQMEVDQQQLGIGPIIPAPMSSVCVYVCVCVCVRARADSQLVHDSHKLSLSIKSNPDVNLHATLISSKSE